MFPGFDALGAIYKARASVLVLVSGFMPLMLRIMATSVRLGLG